MSGYVKTFKSLLVYNNKHYLQVYLDNCADKIGNEQMTLFWWKSFWRLDIINAVLW